ncbi:MAG: helix-turn-helix domain-containing protein [Fuerstiella sp.]
MLMMTTRKPDPDPYDPNQLLTIKHVAQLLQVGEQTIRNRIELGQFLAPTHKFGRQLRWRRAELLEYLKQLKCE